MSIRYRDAVKEDYDKVLKFLSLNFFPEEPLTAGIKPNIPDEAEVEFVMSQFLDGMGIIAEDEETGEMAGVLIANPKYPDEKEHLEREADKLDPNSKWAKMLRLLATVEGQANVFKRYNVDKAMHGLVSCVDTRYRGKAISFKLKEKAMEIAKAKGFPVWTCDCTSFYSARVSAKLNMEVVNVLPYTEYLNSNGQQIFNPPPPHKAVQTYAIQL